MCIAMWQCYQEKLVNSEHVEFGNFSGFFRGIFLETSSCLSIGIKTTDHKPHTTIIAAKRKS
jgi:hypothetical protein